MSIFLQIFLLVDVFIVGAVAAIAISHALEHYRPRHEDKPAHPEHKDPPLSKEVRDKLIVDAEAKYQNVLEKAAEQFSKEMSATTEKINESVKGMATDIMKKEHEAFMQLINEYQSRALSTMENTKNQTAVFENEIKTKLQEDAEKERQRLLQLVDDKLSDAVMSFLTEAMQHEVDLGAQTDYLIKQLEEHKQEFKQALEHEA